MVMQLTKSPKDKKESIETNKKAKQNCTKLQKGKTVHKTVQQRAHGQRRTKHLDDSRMKKGLKGDAFDLGQC